MKSHTADSERVNEFLPRDAMHKRGLYAVMRCPSVLLSVMFVYCVKKVGPIIVSSIFLHSDSYTILVFHCHALWQYSDGDPSLTAASNAGGVSKTRYARQIYGFGIDG